LYRKFVSDATTPEEAMAALYDAGFTCVTKNPIGKIIPNNGLAVKVSAGEF
jgi:hypothetical protein